MNLRLLISSFIVGSMALSALAQDPWLHIYRSDNKFNSVELKKVESVTALPDKGSDAASELLLNLLEGDPVMIPVSAFSHMKVSPNVPAVYITTDDPSFTDVHDKTTEWPAKISIVTNGFPGMEEVKDKEFKLRGRGNSTLGMPKKPYRLKFSKKLALHSDLRSAKNYVFLANYIDNSLMRNTVAYKVAQLLDLPYTPHAVPLNLWINDRYRGSYILCEKTGLNSGNIHDIDETEGILLELDTNVDPSDTYFTDEEGHKSIAPFGFPVAIKDPDFKELEEDGSITSADSAMRVWQDKFTELAMTLAGRNDLDWTDQVDLESAVRYVMTFHLCGNLELKHPKSCFLRAKTIDSKFEFGPIWDFDWAFSYDNYEGAQSPAIVTFGGRNSASSGNRGAAFFEPVITDERFQKRFGEVWQDFVDNKFPEFLEYFDEYAALIEPTAALNGELWPDPLSHGAQSSSDFVGASARLRRWMQDRVNFISTAPNFGLYESKIDQDLSQAPEGMTEVKLSTDNVTASDPDPEEGPLADLFDGDQLTHYHSNWHSSEGHDPKYGSYLDITLPEEATSIAFDMYLRTGNKVDNTGIPESIDLYTSTDGENWELMAQVKDICKDYFYDGYDYSRPSKTSARLGTYTAAKPFTRLRLAVTGSMKGSLTRTFQEVYDSYQWVIEQGWMTEEMAIKYAKEATKTYWYLSELRLYAK
ncbi:MAG: CotH kinase family protein [Pseudoflavonifractor sp.]|nr:CotH kinase family protein [Alloprevotella sp.]MCM1117083.1 CotH kinase family protein [Pseudoflavonifractor sp.]